mmetsp:Transcript_12409/g.35018  ORF Transcript_12409/g.35018 Transcript_12409/m.35018 type:complete len:291 (+) Transcript_12409:303-1175(+)
MAVLSSSGSSSPRSFSAREKICSLVGRLPNRRRRPPSPLARLASSRAPPPSTSAAPPSNASSRAPPSTSAEGRGWAPAVSLGTAWAPPGSTIWPSPCSCSRISSRRERAASRISLMSRLMRSRISWPYSAAMPGMSSTVAVRRRSTKLRCRSRASSTRWRRSWNSCISFRPRRSSGRARVSVRLYTASSSSSAGWSRSVAFTACSTSPTQLSSSPSRPTTCAGSLQASSTSPICFSTSRETSPLTSSMAMSSSTCAGSSTARCRARMRWASSAARGSRRAASRASRTSRR